MSWFGGLWKSQTNSAGEERGKESVNTLLQSLKVHSNYERYLSLQSQQEERELINLTVQNLERNQYILEEFRDQFRALQKTNQKEQFAAELFENEEDNKDFIRICLWLSKCYSRNISIIRPTLDCLCSILKAGPKHVKVKGKNHYLQFLLTEVLFENYTTYEDDPNRNRAQSSSNNNNNGICFLLEFLSTSDFHVQLYTIQLLAIVIENNKLSQLQGMILSQPMTVERIMQLIEDERDALRVQIISFLISLTQSNVELQKLIAFSGGFEKSLAIIQKGGNWGDSLVIINDCFQLIKNLLYKNVSNQNYFRETSSISKLYPFLEIQSSDYWILTDSQISQLSFTLDIVCYFVDSATNPNTSTNQNAFRQSHILGEVIELALNRINAPLIRSKALRTLGYLIKDHSDNRNYFFSKKLKIAGEEKPQTTLDRLMVIAFQSTNFNERISALFVFTSYLNDNSEAQIALASTFTPPPDHFDDSTTLDNHSNNNAVSHHTNTSIGVKLISKLMIEGGGGDELSCYIASQMISSILKDNLQCKNKALSIPLSLRAEQPSTSNLLTLLFEHLQSLISSSSSSSSNHLNIGSGTSINNNNNNNNNVMSSSSSSDSADRWKKVLVIGGIMKMITRWLDHSPRSITQFLKPQKHLEFLVSGILQPLDDDSSSPSSSSSSSSSSVSPRSDHQLRESGASFYQGFCAFILGLCYLHCDESGVEDRSVGLHAIIAHRIGIDKFVDKLDRLRKSPPFMYGEQHGGDFSQSPILSVVHLHEYYASCISNAATHPHPLDLLLFDYDYTVFFKESYDQLIKGIRSPNKRISSMSNNNLDLIKSKDAQIASLQNLVRQLQSQIDQSSSQTSESITPTPIPSPPPPTTEGEISRDADDDNERKKENERLKEEISELHERINELEREVNDSRDNFESLSLAYNHLETAHNSKDVELQSLLLKLNSAPHVNNDNNDNNNVSDNNNDDGSGIQSGIGSDELKHQIDQFKGKINELVEENQSLKSSITSMNKKIIEMERDLSSAQMNLSQKDSHILELQKKLQSDNQIKQEEQKQQQQHHELLTRIKELEDEAKDWRLKYGVLEKEQDDVLILLVQEQMKSSSLEQQLSTLRQ